MEFVKDLLPSLVTFSGILIGVWQFNRGQKNLQEAELKQREFEALTKFKAFQLSKYSEATEIISKVVNENDFQSVEFRDNLRRFWQIYWVELSSVEDHLVEAAMKKLGDDITPLETRNFQNVKPEEIKRLKHLGYKVAQAIKQSSKNWELPKTV